MSVAMTVFVIMAMPMIVVGKPVPVKAIVLAMIMAAVFMTVKFCAHGHPSSGCARCEQP